MAAHHEGDDMTSSTWLRWSVVALATWQILAAALSQTGVLPGEDVGAISDRYDSWIDPAGYAFSIWGLIYAASLVLAVYQVSAARAKDTALTGIRLPVALAFLCNGVWIIAFQQEQFVAAQVVIVVLTASLAVAYATLARRGRPAGVAQRWIVFTTVGVYLGWATVATVAGTSTTLLAEGVTDVGLATGVWAALALIVATLLAVGVTVAGPPEPGFPLATAWGLAAIAVEQGAQRPVVGALAAGGAALALVALGWREAQWQRRGGAVAQRS